MDLKLVIYECFGHEGSECRSISVYQQNFKNSLFHVKILFEVTIFSLFKTLFMYSLKKISKFKIFVTIYFLLFLYSVGKKDEFTVKFKFKI